jgi:hypothetical protein
VADGSSAYAQRRPTVSWNASNKHDGLTVVRALSACHRSQVVREACQAGCAQSSVTDTAQSLWADGSQPALCTLLILTALVQGRTYLWEVLLDHSSNVLCVVEVQCCINLIENVDGSRLEPAQKPTPVA